MTEKKAKELVKEYIKNKLSTVLVDVKIVKSEELNDVLKTAKTFLIIDWEQSLFEEAQENLKLSNAINFLKKRNFIPVLVNPERN